MTKLKFKKNIEQKISIFLIVFLLALSVIPRFWQLTKYPAIVVDEPANLRDIDKLIAKGGFRPIDYEWGYGQATLVHYPTILLIKAGIPDEFFALRLTSVFLSILLLLPFFLIVKKFTNIVVAFCTTLIFSFSYYYLQFSRVGWTNIHTLVFGLYYLLFIDLSLKEKKISFPFLILSAIFAGLLLYTYRAGELFILAGIFILLLKTFKLKKKILTKFAIFFIFFLISISVSYPWVSKISENWDLYNLRASVVSIKNAGRPYHGLTNYNDILKYQTFETFKSWILFIPVKGNGGNIENPRYLPLKYPSVSPLLIPLFWIGLILAIKKWRNTFPFLFIFAAGLTAGQIMTVHPPNGSRGLIVLPVIYLFIGFSLNYIYNKIPKSFANLTVIFFSILVALSDFIFYQNWMTWIKV